MSQPWIDSLSCTSHHASTWSYVGTRALGGLFFEARLVFMVFLVEQPACRPREAPSPRLVYMGRFLPGARVHGARVARGAQDTGIFVPASEEKAPVDGISIAIGAHSPAPDRIALEVVPLLADVAEPCARATATVALHARALVVALPLLGHGSLEDSARRSATASGIDRRDRRAISARISVGLVRATGTRATVQAAR